MGGRSRPQPGVQVLPLHRKGRERLLKEESRHIINQRSATMRNTSLSSSQLCIQAQAVIDDTRNEQVKFRQRVVRLEQQRSDWDRNRFRWGQPAPRQPDDERKMQYFFLHRSYQACPSSATIPGRSTWGISRVTLALKNGETQPPSYRMARRLNSECTSVRAISSIQQAASSPYRLISRWSRTLQLSPLSNGANH